MTAIVNDLTMTESWWLIVSFGKLIHWGPLDSRRRFLWMGIERLHV